MIERPPVKPSEGLHEDRQAEEAVDDRGHAGQVADVDADQAGEPAVLGVLLDVDRGGDAQGEGDDATKRAMKKEP